MNSQEKSQMLNWEQYRTLLPVGKINLNEQQKTPQEIEAEKLMQQCVRAVEQGKPFS